MEADVEDYLKRVTSIKDVLKARVRRILIWLKMPVMFW
jgi:hypothetical protein